MKKGWKIFWIICSSVLGIGLILCITGAALGGTLSGIRNTYETGTYFGNGVFWHHNDWDYEEDGDYEDWFERDYDDYEDYEDEYIQGSGEDISNFPDIRELSVEISYLQVIVKEGDSDSVIVDASQVNSQLKDKLLYGKEDGELKIESNDHRFWKQIGKNNAGTLMIQLPKDRQLEDVSLEVGAGQLTIESIKTGCLDIEVGAGQAIARDFEVKDLNVDCGAGQAKLTGAVNRKVEIDCGVGAVEASLAGTEKDFNYQLKCDIGELQIGTESYTGLGNKRHIDNGAGKQMDVECGIGKVDISFGEEF